MLNDVIIYVPLFVYGQKKEKNQHITYSKPTPNTLLNHNNVNNKILSFIYILFACSLCRERLLSIVFGTAYYGARTTEHAIVPLYCTVSKYVSKLKEILGHDNKYSQFNTTRMKIHTVWALEHRTSWGTKKCISSK